MPIALRATNGYSAYFQGSLASFIVSTVRSVNQPVETTNLKVKVVEDTTTNIVLPETDMTRAPQGYFFYDWDVPSDQTPGLYTVTITGTMGSETVVVFCLPLFHFNCCAYSCAC